MTARQKRKVRNPGSKVSRKRSNAHFKKRPLPMPDIIRTHWSKEKTLRENYSNLGLMVRLNGCTGGKQDQWIDNVPTTLKGLEEQWTELDGGYMHEKYRQHASTATSITEEAVVERDKDGNIIGMRFVPKDNTMDNKEETGKNAEVAVRELNDFAPAVQVELSESAKAMRSELAQMLENGVNKVETHMPPGEVEFCRECIAKYNDDYKAMSRDLRLNTLQWTANQIKRKLERFRRC